MSQEARVLAEDEPDRDDCADFCRGLVNALLPSLLLWGLILWRFFL